jgi:type IVB pilus formation R64 PilN family outer membrane protein
MLKFKFLMGLLASSVAVTGCTVSQKANSNVDVAANHASQGVTAAASPLPAADKSPIKMHNGVFVGTKAVRNENGDPLPGKFERPNGVQIVRVNPIGLREIGAILTEQTKIPMVLAAAAPSGPGSAPSGSNSPDMSSNEPAQAPANSGLAAGPIPANFPLDQALAEIRNGSGGPAQNSGGGTISASVQSVSATSIPLNYTGSLSGLLDIVSAHFNVAWRYEGGKIVLDQVVTRSFDVPALSVSASLSFDLGTQSSSGGTGGGSSATGNSSASTKSEINVFGELDTGLKELVGDGTFSINKVTGVVTVTATPATTSRVAKFIEGVNERLSDQVAMSVKVYSVTLTDSEAFNLDIAGIFKKTGKYGINLGNAAATAGVVPAVGAAEGAGFGWALLNPSSEWYGTNALVDALSTAGKVSEVRNLNQVTLNGIPVPIQVGELRDYVSKVEKTTSDTGESFTVETDNVSTGFSMQLAPRIQRDGDVILQYGLNISELVGTEDGFDSYTTPDGQKLQLRRMKQRNFIQQARIPNGNTLVLAGFDQVKSKDNRRGAGSANFPLFGGGRDSSVEHEIIVMAIPPTVLKK